MAITNTFKNSKFKAGTSATFCYSCPDNTTAVMQSMYVTNTSNAETSVSIQIYNPTDNQPTTIAGNVPIPRGSVFYLDRPLNLMARDVIQIIANRSDACEGAVSVMEMT